MTGVRRFSGLTPALAVLVVTTPLSAQGVRGQLVDRGNGFPIGGAFVVLLGQDGKEAARVLTGPDGTFLLRAPTPGTYRLQSKRIGFRVSDSPPLVLPEGQIIPYRLAIEAVPARLPPVVVEGHPQCGTRGAEGSAVAGLWEEAREALAAVRWTAGQRTLHYTVEMFDRDFGVGGSRVLKEQRSSRSGYSESPFKSISGQRLVAQGYVVIGARDTVEYYAPDAEVLLGDTFVNTHCFTAREGGNEHPGLVGLVFEPAPKRSLPDVDGVLWIEKNSLELQFLDFKYARLPFGLPEGALGGHVEFMRIPSGAWIVKDWWIRMAVMGKIVYSTGRPPEPKVMGFRESGGEVVTISASSGNVMYSSVEAILEGTVVDSLRGGAPLARASVFLEGLERATTTDDQGRFQLAGRLEGEYAVAFRHPRLDSLGFVPDAAPVRLTRGGRATVTLAVPPEPTIASRLCPGGLREDQRVIVGTVYRSGTEEPVPGVEVRAEWQAVVGGARILAGSDFRATAVTDSSGAYALCGIPREERVTVRTMVGAGAGRTVILDFNPTGLWINGQQYRSLPGRIWKQNLEVPG